MPHAESLKMLNMMDFVRDSNNIKFPGEDNLAIEEQSTETSIEEQEAQNKE